MSETLLKASHLAVVQHKKELLYNINLVVKSNDFMTIIGPNGAGKSLLIKCLLGLFKPTSGTIYRKPSLTIGYMPQKLNLNTMLPIKVKEFLLLGQTKTTQLDTTVIEQTTIGSFLEQSLHEISGGQLQRVLMARALLKKPDLLIMDEPAQNLDVSSQLGFYKFIDDIYKTNKMSILMISHDLHFVMSSSTQIICLFKHICCSGKSDVIVNDPSFINLFGKDFSGLMQGYRHQHVSNNGTTLNKVECQHD